MSFLGNSDFEGGVGQGDMVRVLIVDDSAFMRNAIRGMLSSDPEITIVGVARDGVEAVEKTMELKPDIVTMDLDMPRMNGIEALKLIMQKSPVPVLMVSSLTTEGARETLTALDLGAVDFIPKNLSELKMDIMKIKPILIEKIKVVARRGLVRRGQRPAISPAAMACGETPAVTWAARPAVVTIGASTGGPKALEEILTGLPGDFPLPIVIALHMPENFTALFAERLNSMSKLSVKEATEGESLRPGVVYIAPGRGHIELNKNGIKATLSISQNGETLYRPSVDRLFITASRAYPGRILGVILTGMGNDGLKGAEAVKKSGGRIFVQDEDTCVVYGMPRAVVEAGLADKTLPIERISDEIKNAV